VHNPIVCSRHATRARSVAEKHPNSLIDGCSCRRPCIIGAFACVCIAQRSHEPKPFSSIRHRWPVDVSFMRREISARTLPSRCPPTEFGPLAGGFGSRVRPTRRGHAHLEYIEVRSGLGAARAEGVRMQPIPLSWLRLHLDAPLCFSMRRQLTPLTRRGIQPELLGLLGALPDLLIARRCLLAAAGAYIYNCRADAVCAYNFCAPFLLYFSSTYSRPSRR
jgi:hypothetical protein